MSKPLFQNTVMVKSKETTLKDMFITRNVKIIPSPIDKSAHSQDQGHSRKILHHENMVTVFQGLGCNNGMEMIYRHCLCQVQEM